MTTPYSLIGNFCAISIFEIHRNPSVWLDPEVLPSPLFFQGPGEGVGVLTPKIRYSPSIISAFFSWVRGCLDVLRRSTQQPYFSLLLGIQPLPLRPKNPAEEVTSGFYSLLSGTQVRPAGV